MSSTDMEKQPLLEVQNAADPERQEPTLSELQQNVFTAQRAYMKAWSRTTSGKWHRRIMFSVTALLLTFMLFCFAIIAQDSWNDDYTPVWNGRVPLEVHMMSKCPDAKDCLHDMILPAMQKVGRKVDFKLSYIGNVTDNDDGVVCKHGQEECLGNIVELCAAKLYPDPKIYLGFTMCLTKQYEDVGQRTLFEDCALEHGMSMQKLNDCAIQDDGSMSVDMLQSSFNRSRSAGVNKSCTIRLNGETRCVRDDGEWKECEGGSTARDLVRDIMNLTSSESRMLSA